MLHLIAAAMFAITMNTTEPPRDLRLRAAAEQAADWPEPYDRYVVRPDDDTQDEDDGVPLLHIIVGVSAVFALAHAAHSM